MTLRDRMVEIQARGTRLAIAIAPSLAKMPYPLQRYDDPFLPYSKAVIDATADLTAAYVFDLAAYLSVGASGAIALERAIAYVPSTCMTILHGTFADPAYANWFAPGGFHAEAATISFSLTLLEDATARFLEYVCGVFCTWGDPDLPRHQIGRMGKYTTIATRESLDPKFGLRLLAIDRRPQLSWGCYGDSIALAGRGEDYRDLIRQAAVIRHAWLNNNWFFPQVYSSEGDL